MLRQYSALPTMKGKYVVLVITNGVSVSSATPI